MKNSKIILTGVLAFASASMAYADATVRITGSTAFRAATMTAIGNVLTGVKSAYFTGDGSSSLSGANLAIIQGTHATFGTVTVKCVWNGSAAGVQILDQNISLSQWMANANLPGSGSVGVASPTFDAAAAADVAMSDCFQASTPFNATSLLDTNIVAVVPFRWVANNGSPAAISNATPNLVQALLTGGMPLSMWTQNPADAGSGVYAMGRNADSGTRIITFAENGFGITTLPQQYRPKTVTGGTTITEMELYPAETVLGIFYDVGTSGYSSGGTLANQMKLLASPTIAGGAFGPGYFITYAGRSDANNIVSGGGHLLTWNGYDDTDSNIREGRYTFWGYEHMMYRTSFSGTEKSVAVAIAQRLAAVDAAPTGILLGTMNVERQSDGGLVTHK